MMCGMTAGSERNEQNALLITFVNDTFHSMPIGTSFITWSLFVGVDQIVWLATIDQLVCLTTNNTFSVCLRGDDLGAAGHTKIGDRDEFKNIYIYTYTCTHIHLCVANS